MNPCTCGGPPGPCTCGGQPNPCVPGFGSWSFRLRDCFNEIAAFQAFLTQMLSSLTAVPLKGDVSGKAAAAGIIGESVSNTTSGTFTAALQTQSLTAIVLQPGDWDVELAALFTGAAGAALNLNGALMYLNPLPAGVSANGYAISPQPFTAPAAGVVPIADTTGWRQLISPRFQAVVASPTVLTLTLVTNLTAAGAAGNFSITTTARRER